MVTNGRLVWSMARDRRLPGHQLWSQVPRATGGPSYATVLTAVLGAIIVLVLKNNSDALVDLFTASSIMPALLYAATVILYVFRGRRITTDAGFFNLGQYEAPIVVGALVWLAYELVVLIGPHEFRTAQYYVLASIGLGVIVFIVQMLTEPTAMRNEPASLTGATEAVQSS
jgi:amino acid transporter